MWKTLLLLATTLLLAGCQAGPQVSKGHGTDESSFTTVWHRYNDCRTSSDLAAMQVYQRDLQARARELSTIQDEIFSLPSVLQQHVTQPKPRLAVDPQAMAAACTLYTGWAALAAERDEVAYEMFRSVVVQFSETDYPYYVAQAREGLERISLLASASDRPTPLRPVVVGALRAPAISAPFAPVSAN